MSATFHINEIAPNQFAYCLASADGQVLISSGAYDSEQDARDAIESLCEAVAEAEPNDTLLNMR